MDISYWIQHNPKISVEHTAKKFYGKYLYKLVLYAPAGRLIHTKGDIGQELQVRKSYNWGGSWYRHDSSLSDADAELLLTLRSLKHRKIPGIKLRVEEPRVQIYGDSMEQLQDVVTEYFSSFPPSYIETIAGPYDVVAEAALNSGAIIRKNDIGYKYKIILKDGAYPIEIKESILSYLRNLGTDVVGIPNGTVDMLSRSSQYMWHCYYYCNDLDINTFISVICPGIITNCHELVVLPHK